LEVRGVFWRLDLCWKMKRKIRRSSCPPDVFVGEIRDWALSLTGVW